MLFLHALSVSLTPPPRTHLCRQLAEELCNAAGLIRALSQEGAQQEQQVTKHQGQAAGVGGVRHYSLANGYADPENVSELAINAAVLPLPSLMDSHRHMPCYVHHGTAVAGQWTCSAAPPHYILSYLSTHTAVCSPITDAMLDLTKSS
jgi:hypothetical protein